MSKRLKFVISLLSLLSFIFIGYSIPRLEIREIPYLLFWIFLGALFESLPIYYAKGRTVSVTFAITLAAQLSHGVYFAAIVAAFTAILAIFKDSKGTYKHLFNLPISVSLINLSNYTISMFLAGWFYHYLERIWSSFSSIPVMPIATLAYVILVFLLNSLIMSLYTSLMTDNPFLKTWVSGTLWALPNFIAIAPIGFFIYKMYFLPSGIIYIIMLLGPLLLARYSFKLYLDSKEQYYNIIQTLTAAIEAKDKYTEGHSRRVAYYVEKIAEKMKLSHRRIEFLKVAALLHDIGKIGIEDSILRKPGKLTSDEWEKIQQHPHIGIRILDEVAFTSEIKDAILHHHERYSGGGYPDALDGSRVSINAFILGAADAYDAMTSTRPYRKALSRREAIDVLKKEKGSQFHPRVADILISILEKEERDELLNETEADEKSPEYIEGLQFMEEAAVMEEPNVSYNKPD